MRSTNIKGPIGTIHIIEASPSVTAGESESLPVVFVHGMAVSAKHLGGAACPCRPYPTRDRP